MLEKPVRDRRAERHAATRAEILDAAWEQVRASGLAALSLRDLARSVGMQPPSLYSYFDSKNAIYDAMYAQGAQQFVDEQQASMPTPDDRSRRSRPSCASSSSSARRTSPATSCCSSARSPGSSPRRSRSRSPRTTSPSSASCSHGAACSDPEMLDLFTALGTGLADQQLSNDPGGDRWIRLIDDAVEMFYEHIDQEGEASQRREGERR